MLFAKSIGRNHIKQYFGKAINRFGDMESDRKIVELFKNSKSGVSMKIKRKSNLPACVHGTCGGDKYCKG